MIYIPDNIVNKIDDLVYNFLWNSIFPKIRIFTMITSITDSGLGMFDTETKHQSAKK